MAYAADHVITVNGVSCYDGMYNEIHVNKKWFFISKESLRVYLTQTEKANGVFPKGTCKSKQYLIRYCFYEYYPDNRAGHGSVCICHLVRGRSRVYLHRLQKRGKDLLVWGLGSGVLLSGVWVVGVQLERMVWCYH